MKLLILFVVTLLFGCRSDTSPEAEANISGNNASNSSVQQNIEESNTPQNNSSIDTQVINNIASQDILNDSLSTETIEQSNNQHLTPSLPDEIKVESEQHSEETASAQSDNSNSSEPILLENSTSDLQPSINDNAIPPQEADEAEIVDVSAEPAEPAEPASNNENDKTTSSFSDLFFPNNFNLNRSYDMTIKLDLNTIKTLRISIYHDFNVVTSGVVLPMSSSLLTSGTIVNGDFNGTIRVTSSMQFIFIQLYDSNANQIFYQAIKETSPNGITIVE